MLTTAKGCVSSLHADDYRDTLEWLKFTPGGDFDIKRLAPCNWRLTVLDMQMKGKVLFCKTIGVQQDYSGNEFKRMPDDSSPVKGRRDSEQKRWVLASQSGMGIK